MFKIIFQKQKSDESALVKRTLSQHFQDSSRTIRNLKRETFWNTIQQLVQGVQFS